VQGSAIEIVNIVQTNPVSEIQERQNHIFLRGQMQSIEAVARLDELIDPVHLYEIFNNLHICAIGCIE
jgi:hypothetical protein